MKVGIFLSRMKSGGGVRSQLMLAHQLSARGVEVEVIVHKGKFFSTPIPLEVPMREIGPAIKNDFLSYPICSLWGLFQLIRKDVVLTTFAPEYALLRLASYVMGGRVVLFSRHYDPILLDSSKIGNPILLSLYKLIARKSLSIAPDLLVNSRSTAERIAAGLGRQVPFTVIPNGVDSAVFSPRENNQRVEEKQVRIMVIGKSQKYKGLDDALQAIEMLRHKLKREVALTIVSQDELHVNDASFSINFERPQNDEQLANLYCEADLFLSTSWYEGFCNPPLEAMACGTPVVATESGGITEYARNNENCFLVPIKDPAAVAAAMLRLIEDREMYKHLKEEGLKTAAQFTWSSAAEKLLAHLEAKVRE